MKRKRLAVCAMKWPLNSYIKILGSEKDGMADVTECCGDFFLLVPKERVHIG